MKIALSAQIAAVEVMTTMMHVCERHGGLRGKEADLLRPRLAAALETLRWLQTNEEKIKGRVDAS